MTVAIVVFITGTVAYTIDLTLFYPSRAASSFDVDVRERIKNGEHPEYPGLAKDYYNF
jgi:hypothetical protein